MWSPTKNKKCGVCIYNYDGNTTYGLPLEIGETVHILEESEGWFRGYSTRNKSVKGLFPESYICFKPFRIKNKGSQEVISSAEDATVQEVASVLREWHSIWKKLYVKRNVVLFPKLQTVMRELIEWRRQLIIGTLTQDQIQKLKAKVTAKVDWGNRQLGLDFVPRVESEVVDPQSLSPLELYQVHVQSSDSLPAIGTSATPTIKKKEPAQQAVSHHLFLALRDFNYCLGEDVDIYFSLYDAQRAKFISEKFLVKILKSGQSHFVEKLHNQCTVFTDLGSGDLKKDLYIVSHLIRIGRMLNDSKKSSSHSYRRPHGCAVLPISDILQSQTDVLVGEEREFTVKVYMCPEADFHIVHELMIKKQTSKLIQLPGQPNYGLMISLRMLHGQLNQLKHETPLLFKQITITPKMGFSDIIMPGDVRNDLYFTLEKGDFEKGGKSTNKNIEAAIVLISPDGHILEDCIGPGSGQENLTTFHSLVLYHNNSPRWADTLKLAIPIERFDGAHMRLEFYHCSTRDKEKKLLGFSFCQLMVEKGTILCNGQHDLYVYKCEDRSKLLDPNSYLSMLSGPRGDGGKTPGSVPPSPSPLPAMTAFPRSPRELVVVSTLLCSTKLTQNGDLLSLLKWKSQPEKIQDTLFKIMKLDGEEVVKFLQDILDALFSMFSTGDGNSTSHSGLVFKVLVHILNLLEDSRFQHFRSVMDTYISKHFAAALVYKGLISCIIHCAELVRESDKQDAIHKCFLSLEYIFKFIIQSRILYARATGDQNEDGFKTDLFSLFNTFAGMLAIVNEPVVLPAQVALVSNFSHLYVQLLRVFPHTEVTKIVKLTMDCLPLDSCPISLVQAKLDCIQSTIQSSLFHNTDCRAELLEVFTKHIKEHLLRQQEYRKCADIIGEVLTVLYHEQTPHSQELEILASELLETQVYTLKCIISNGHNGGPLLTCLISLLQLLEGEHYNFLWNQFVQQRARYRDLVLTIMVLFGDLVKNPVFPKDWMVMEAVTNHIILKCLKEIASALCSDFLEGDNFDKELWSSYFTVAVTFLTQPSLQLDTFSEVKRSKIIEKYGDLRVQMGFQILSMWDKLGSNKIHFIPAMTGPFLEVTLVPEVELRKSTLPIFFDMMDCEQQAHGNFKQVESELIDKLDILISENKGDDEYYQLFNTILLGKVKSNDPVWKENGIVFVNSITKLLERLLDYRNVMEGEENRDKRMSCTMNLLNFYKTEINRREMYIRYIYKLCELHIPAENYSEAGFTLRLHSELLDWSDTVLPADQRYPAQPSWQRREELYQDMVKYFDKGKCWEEGIPLCKELAHLYETRLFDYSKLSAILKTQAKFLDNILTQIRPEPEYFRVGFYGLAFPLFLRNKVFIYRGLEYERIETFTQRLQLEFPQAHTLMKNTPPDESILNSDGQYIQICNVKPIPDLARFEGKDIPDKVLSYYLVNDVCKFQADRPLHKEPIDKENEFKSLWIERTILTTGFPLPGILRWLEVIEKHVEELSPVIHACETVQHMNKKLRQLISQYTTDPRRSISPLSMRLQGVIEAAVNGGIAKYQEAFFTNEYSTSHPHEKEKINLLKSLISEKVQILDGGLSLHGRLAPKDVLPLHRRLVDRFGVMKHSFREHTDPSARSSEYRRPSIVNTPLPPIPTDTLKKPLDCSSNRSSSSGSSLYGQFVPSDDEDIYSRPQDDRKCTPTPPPLPSRPRSVTLSSNGKGQSIERLRQSSRDSMEDGGVGGYASPRILPPPLSPRLLTRSPSTTPSSSARNSWSSESHHDEENSAPPLPPRSCTDKKLSSSHSLNEEQRPALPKRSLKKHKPSSSVSEPSYVQSGLFPETPPPLPSKKSAPLCSPSHPKTIVGGSND